MGLTNRSSQPLAVPMTSPHHVYEVRPRSDKRGVDLISDALPFGRLWYDGPVHYQLRLQHPSWLATRVTLQFCVKPSIFTASSKSLVHHQPYRFALVG
jgi:hypothetical protein